MEITVNIETLKEKFPENVDLFGSDFEYWYSLLHYHYTFSISQTNAWSSVCPYLAVRISKNVYPVHHEYTETGEVGTFYLERISDFKYLVMFLLADVNLPDDLLGGTHRFSPVSYR